MKSYVCDPARNTACTKGLCFENGGPCGITDNVRYALRDLFGDPVEIINQTPEENDEHDRRKTDRQ